MRKVTTFPWILLNNSLGEAVNTPGGILIRCQANSALLGGDVVYIQDALQVDKSTTASLYDNQCGIVVSGTKVWAGTDNWVPEDTSLIGVSVAAADDNVLVCIQGLCYGIAGEAITAPASLVPSGATAGRLAVDATPTADEAVARAFGDQAAAGSGVLVLVGFN